MRDLPPGFEPLVVSVRRRQRLFVFFGVVFCLGAIATAIPAVVEGFGDAELPDLLAFVFVVLVLAAAGAVSIGYGARSPAKTKVLRALIENPETISSVRVHWIGGPHPAIGFELRDGGATPLIPVPLGTEKIVVENVSRWLARGRARGTASSCTSR